MATNNNNNTTNNDDNKLKRKYEEEVTLTKGLVIIHRETEENESSLTEHDERRL